MQECVFVYFVTAYIWNQTVVGSQWCDCWLCGERGEKIIHSEYAYIDYKFIV